MPWSRMGSQSPLRAVCSAIHCPYHSSRCVLALLRGMELTPKEEEVLPMPRIIRAYLKRPSCPCLGLLHGAHMIQGVGVVDDPVKAVVHWIHHEDRLWPWHGATDFGPVDDLMPVLQKVVGLCQPKTGIGPVWTDLQ